MRNLAVMAAFVLLLAAGGYAVFAGGPRPGGGSPAVPTGAVGTTTGAFDSQMSGVCQFACAARQAYDEEDLAPQPGVANGQLTQCPVSGVVFVVDDARPRFALLAGEYVLCCDGCTERFRKKPGRFVNL